ncbi:MAG: putative lipid II flippase FtsW [Clostridia bacterium]|nr:putative lipid II flippase FtsW [Clostridia bacterium]
MRALINNGKIREATKNNSKSKVDKKLLFLTICLLTLGTIMVFSASYPYALSHYGDGYYYLKRQAVFLAIGLIAMYVMSRLNIQILKKIAPIFYIVCILLLVLVLIGGFSEGLAKRWLGIPGTPLSFQPSELMKLGIILMLGWWLNKIKESKKSFKNEIILPGVFLFLACGLVLLEKHLSGTIILAMIGLSILFICGTSIKKMLLAYGITGLAGASVFLLTNDYAMKRIESFLNPNADILSDKWQTTQGLYAIGSGGLWGRGIGNSIQKYSYVSEPQNDFIFTIWCEETGYIGAILVIALFFLLIQRGYKIALGSDDMFSSITAFGITSQIGIQAFLNMAVVSDLIPNTGISLPFFSYGGSSLVILLAEMGILLSISRRARCKR